MKRCFVLLMSCLLLVSFLSLPTAAADYNNDDQIVVSQTVDYIGNGCYYVETIYVPAIQAYSSTKTGTKVAECISSGTTIYTVSVTGIFTYDGSSAEATSATAKIAAYVEGVTLNSKRAYTSGASACAFASVSYNGVTLQKTVTLTCDKNGNLS